MSEESLIWQSLLECIQKDVPQVQYRTWFQDKTRPLGMSGDSYVIGVPHSFAKDWIKNHYGELIETCLSDLRKTPVTVSFEVVSFDNSQQELFSGQDAEDLLREQAELSSHKPSNNLPDTNSSPNNIKQYNQDFATPLNNTPRSNTSRNNTPLNNTPLNNTPRNNTTSSNSANLNGLNKAPEMQQPTPISKRLSLNHKYIFSNFVVGPNNSLAHAAALATAESPGRAYNPLFIYGDAGLGKTHLMHAVGQAAAERFPHMQVEYVTTETFTNDLVTAIRSDNMVQFRDRYRNIDLLLVDDIQFLDGKERTQEEFFHTFNTLYESGKQIILSSDRPPRDISTLENRLRSRFEWGLITDIQAPDLETRMAILKLNAENHKVNISDDVITYIAYQAAKNIRELEGALMRVIVYASMNGAPMNRSTAANALSDVFTTNEDISLSLEDISQTVTSHYNTTKENMLSKSRRAEIVKVRQVCMYLMRELTTHSFPEIGQFFSGRDHTTVMHAVQKIEKQIHSDNEIAEEVRSLKSRLAI